MMQKECISNQHQWETDGSNVEDVSTIRIGFSLYRKHQLLQWPDEHVFAVRVNFVARAIG